MQVIHWGCIYSAMVQSFRSHNMTRTTCSLVISRMHVPELWPEHSRGAAKCPRLKRIRVLGRTRLPQNSSGAWSHAVMRISNEPQTLDIRAVLLSAKVETQQTHGVTFPEHRHWLKDRTRIWIDGLQGILPSSVTPPNRVFRLSIFFQMIVSCFA